VNDFTADAVISQLLLLDSQDFAKVSSEVDEEKFFKHSFYLVSASLTCISCCVHDTHQRCPSQDIKLFINSPGGSVTAGMGIYDAMQVHNQMLSNCGILVARLTVIWTDVRFPKCWQRSSVMRLSIPDKHRIPSSPHQKGCHSRRDEFFGSLARSSAAQMCRHIALAWPHPWGRSC
jgi:hypothetical protein